MSNEFDEWSVAVIEAAAAHKALAVERGFSVDAAEAMAVTLHSVLMAEIYEEAEGRDPGLDNPAHKPVGPEE